MLKGVTLLFAAMLVGGCVLRPGCFGTESADQTICAVRYDKNITSRQLQALADQAARERIILIPYFSNDIGPITIIVRDEGIAYHEPPTTIHMPSARLSRCIQTDLTSTGSAMAGKTELKTKVTDASVGDYLHSGENEKLARMPLWSRTCWPNIIQPKTPRYLFVT